MTAKLASGRMRWCETTIGFCAGRASLQCGVRLGCRERLVSLESLLRDVGHRPGLALGTAYSKAWHDRVLRELVLAENEWD